jgi:hypothetical protein
MNKSIKNPITQITRRNEMKMSIKSVFSHKKAVAAGAAIALTLGISGAAFAYFTSSGSGTGAGKTGSSQAVTVVQDSINYNNGGTSGSLSPINFQPGDTAVVAFAITNPGGNEYVNTISLTGWTSNVAGCNSTDTDTADAPSTNSEAGWFTMSPVTVAQQFAHGTDETTGDTGTITFVNEPYIQNVCQGAAITFDYTSN